LLVLAASLVWLIRAGQKAIVSVLQQQLTMMPAVCRSFCGGRFGTCMFECRGPARAKCCPISTVVSFRRICCCVCIPGMSMVAGVACKLGSNAWSPQWQCARAALPKSQWLPPQLAVLAWAWHVFASLCHHTRCQLLCHCC
jgi:hypothetical protein